MTRFRETAAGGNCLSAGGGVRIRSLTELCAKAGVLVQNVYFEGGDVLKCRKGRFRFVLSGYDPIEIGPDEVLVTYPDQRVSIEALDRRNVLVYAILDGSGVAAFFDRQGLFDGVHGRTSDQSALFTAIKSCIDAGAPADDPELMSRLGDVLVTYAHDMREGGRALVFDAARQIRANLTRRIVQIKPLCEQLDVSRAYLHRMFVRAGVGRPSAFLRREQMRLVRGLLRNPSIPIAAVAAEAGFASQTHFCDFIRRYTGLAPRELRHRLISYVDSSQISGDDV